MICGGHLDILGKKEKIANLENETVKADFWNERESANKTINEIVKSLLS